MKVKQVIEIDYNELEKIVNNHYKPAIPFEFVAAQECGNDSSHSFKISEAEEIDQYDLNILNEWKDKGSRQPWPITVFQDLINQGVLAPGEYLVTVCW